VFELPAGYYWFVSRACFFDFPFRSSFRGLNAAQLSTLPIFTSIYSNALFANDVKERLAVPFSDHSHLLRRWIFFPGSLMRNFIGLFNSREKIFDLFRNQVHFAPNENKHQKEKEEIDYPENSDKIHRL
jgi:hypothetical protein